MASPITSFGGVIPVTSLNLGYPGNASRLGERVIAARQVLPATPNPIKFGDPVVIVADSLGGTYQSVADFIATPGTFTAVRFAGVAVRNVKTMLQFVAWGNVQSAQFGNFTPGAMAEVLERGSITVKINNGQPVSQNPVYIRTVFNGAIPAGVVGGFEAVADGTNSVVIPNVVFRTGVLDSNGVAEVTLMQRVAA
jgi:hypothetical protein